MTQPKTPQRVADILAQSLFNAGVRFAFGMPGGEVITFVDALARAGIHFILARNETAAAMMAAGTCTEGRHPGLLVTTLGPGLANAINGIADATQERCPLLVVSGVVDRAIRGRYTHQVVDHKALLHPLVKASFEIEPDSAGETLHRALRLALAPQQGPVHLDLSPSVAAMPAPQTQRPRTLEAARPCVRVDLAEVRARLNQAQRPLMIAGFEAARAVVKAGQPQLVQTWAEASGIPVITTYKAKGLIDERHALSLGAAGLSPLADNHLLALIEAADLVLAVGYDPIEMRQGWMDFVSDPARLVAIGTPADHAMHTCGVAIDAPIAETLQDLLDGVIPHSVWAAREPQQTRGALRALFADAPVERDHFGPHAICRTLQTICGEAVLTIDSGAHRILLSQMWQAQRPLALLQSAGWCTMGSALPLAIGHKLTHPADPVVAVMGDGGLEMTLGELGTLRDQALKITLVVLQDESLALIGLKQTQAQMPQIGVAMGATDYARVAEAFGGVGHTVTTADELIVALQQAQQGATFHLIACRISAQDYAHAF